MNAPWMEPNTPTLQVYLLGSVEFDAALRLQRRLHYEVCEEQTAAGLIICEHPPLISVGRLGSRAHIRSERDDLHGATYPLCWVNRGGGCILHVPGQLAVYPIVPLHRLNLDVAGYIDRLVRTCLALVGDFSLRNPPRADGAGVWVGDRLLAALGVSVRHWVTMFGAYINVQPSLEAFRSVRTTPGSGAPMTSLEAERRGPVRPAMVRQRLLEHLQEVFSFPQVALFTDHPMLSGQVQPGRARRAIRTVSEH
jgi:lipoyl(octanoyl) transferase